MVESFFTANVITTWAGLSADQKTADASPDREVNSCTQSADGYTSLRGEHYIYGDGIVIVSAV